MIENIPSFDKKELHKDTTPPLNEVVSQLLHDSEIAKLPDDAQGKVIVDRFIGALVRHGDVTSSNAEIGAMSPSTVLSLMDKVGTVDESGFTRTVQELTRTDGLRGGVSLLAEDPRTAALFGNLQSQLKTERTAAGKDTYVLATEAQLDGYIEAGGDKNKRYNASPYEDAKAWIGPMMADVHAVASGRQEWILTQDLRDDLKDSGAITPEAYKREKELYEARTTAGIAGVDIEMVRRSAEYMRQRDDLTKKELGERGLFLATGGALRRYQNSHDAWFERHIGN